MTFSARLLIIAFLLASFSSQSQIGCDTLNVPETVEICEGTTLSIEWFEDWVPDLPGPQVLVLEGPDGEQEISLNQNQDWDLSDEDEGVWSWSVDLPGQGQSNICSGTVEIEVNPSPTVAFSYSDEGQCSNGLFSFNNTSAGQDPLDYAWSFGAGGSLGSSNQANPITDLSTIGAGGVNIPVTLSVVDGNDCLAFSTQVISAQGIPDVGLPEDLSALCVNSSIEDYSFQPTWPAISSGSVVSFDWGDGSAVDVYNPGEYFSSLEIDHLYSTYGFFEVLMTVDASNGCSNSESGELFVGANPQVGAANPGGTTGICGPEELVFILDNVDGNDLTTIYIIDWGDDSPLDTLPHPPPEELSHLYDQSSCGFSVESGSATIGNSFYFSVIAQNLCDQSTALITPVRINTAPDVQFSVPYEWCVDEDIITTNTTVPGEVANANECVDNNTYQWLVGPEDALCFDINNPISCCLLPEIQVNCQPAFDFVTSISVPGEYQIELTGSNSCDTDSMVQPICVVPVPQPEFTLDPTIACAPFEVTPENLSNTLESCGNTDYYWIVTDLGNDKKADYGTAYQYLNGTDSLSVEPDIQFLIPGCYTLELQAENRCGPVITDPVDITVLSSPLAMFSGADQLCEGSELELTGTASAGNEDVVDFQWDLDGAFFADGQFVFPECAGDDTQEDVQTFVFDVPGTFEIFFEAENSCGTESQSMEVTVYPLPEVAVLPVAPQACEGDSVFFEASGAATYTWVFDANALETVGNSAAGTLFADLTGTVTGSVGYGALQCSATAPFEATVLELPSPSIVLPSYACDQEEVVAASEVTGGQPNYELEWSGLYGNGTGTTLTLTADVDATGSIELLVTDANGCQGVVSTELPVLDLPSVSAGPDLTLCDQPIVEQLTGFSPSGGTWSGQGIVDALLGAFNPTIAGVGVTELTYTYVDNNGCENSDVMEVSVVQPEIAEAGPDVVICDVDTSFSFVDFTPATSGVWSGPGVSNSSTGAVSAGPLSPGTYTYTYEYGTGTCFSSDTRQLTVLERPMLTLSALDLTVCTGEEASFEASVSGGQGPYVFSWGNNVTEGSGTATTTSASAFMDLTVDPFVVTLMVTDGNGCTDEVSLAVDVLALPSVSAGPDLTLCDQPIVEQLTGFSPSGGTWSGQGIVDALSGTFDPSSAGVGVTELTYTYVDNNGCENSDVMEVAVVQPEIAEAGPDVVICDVDTSFSFVDFTPATSGVWSGPGVSNSSTGAVSAGPLSPGTYTYTYEYGTGTCFSSDTRQLTVLERPMLTLSALDLTVCTGEEASFEASVSGGQGPYVFSWGNNVTEGSGTATTTSASAFMDLTVDPFVVTLMVTDGNGCTDEVSLAVDVLALPSVSAGPDLTLCDQPIVEQLTGFSPSGGTWSGQGIVDALSGTFDPSSAGVGVTELTYTYVDNNGCENSDVMEVAVVQPEIAEAGPDVVICDVDTSFSFVDFTPATSGVWSGPGVSNSSTGAVSAGPLSPGIYTYTYEYGTGTCFSSDTRQLTVLERPMLALSALDLTVCTGEEASFEASVSGGQGPYVFSWGNNVTEGSGTATTTSASALMDLTVDPFVVTLMVTDGNGCTDEVSLAVDVLDLPSVSAGLDTVFCDQPIAGTLEGFSPGLTEGGAGYWTGLGGAAGAVTEEGLYDPSLSGLGLFEAVYTYTADATGCIHTDTIEVNVTEPVVADAGLDTTVCDNAYPLQLEGYFPASGVSWSGMSPEAENALLDEAMGLISPGILTPGSYDYLLEFGYGTCYTRDTVTVNVDALPVIALSSDDVFCVNDGEPLLTTFTPTGGTWEGPGVVDASNGVFAVDGAATGVGDYDLLYWYQDPSTGCRDTAYHEVLVQDIPEVSAGLDTVFCDQPIAGTLEGFSPGLTEGGAGYWTGLGGAAGAVTEEGLYDPSLSGLGLFEAVYTYTADATGCIHTDTIEVNVTEPVVADAGLDTTVCDNAYPLQLEGYFPASGVSWSGMSPEAENALLDEAMGLISPGILTPGSYDYLLEFGYGTCYTRDTVTVNVDALPVIALSSDDVFCVNDGEPLLTTFTPTGGTWEGPGVVDASNGVFAVDGAATGVGDYDLLYWYQDPSTGCRDTAYHEVLVQDIPEVSAGLDTVFCDQPIAGTLEGFSPGLTEGGAGYWTGLGAAAGAVTEEGLYDPSLSGLGVFEAVYTYTADATGCTHADTIEVTVTEPVVADAGLDTTVCNNAYPLQLEGYFPTSGVSWSGMSTDAAGALLDASSGLISPGILTPGSYDYLLEFGVGTCYTRDTVTVNVDALPEITPGTPDAFCANLGVQFLSSMDPLGGTWFGGGILDSASGAFQTDQIPGDYTVNYWYQDSMTGCRDTVNHEIEVLVVPVSDFAVDTLGCSNLDLPISNQSTGAIEFLWDFGTDEESIAVEPEYTYPGDGFYNLVLYATNGFGCTDTSNAEVEITHPPTADFTLTPDSGCAPLDVEFTNVSDGPYSDFIWTINGEEYPQIEPPLLNFLQGDSILDYTVLLEVVNLCGEDALLDSIKVFPTPQMNFVLSEDTVCSPYEMFIVNTSIGLPDDMLWDFGDGTEFVGANPPPHFYAVDSLPEVFDITVIGTNECGTDDTTFSVLVKPNEVQAFFTLSSPVGCAPFALEVTDFSVATTDVAYDFDNGDFANDSVSTTVYPEAGTFDITQYVTNGCSFDTLITSLLVNPAPEVEISVAEPALCESDFFIFEASVSDPGEVVWDFGDGFQIDGLNTIHAYDIAGDYWVVLEAEAALTGCPNSDSVMVTVHPNPVLDLAVLPESGCHPLQVTFENATTGSSFQTWNFSDGSEPSSVYSPVHVFQNLGLTPVSYPVFLTAQSAEFCTSSDIWNVTVLPTPQAGFVLEEETSCSYPIPVLVSNESVGSQTHEWTLDGVPFDGFEPLDWEAEGVGVYPVELTAINSYGCIDVASDEFEVFLPPVAGLDAAPYAGCNPLTVTFSDASFNSTETSLSIDGIYEGPLPSNLVLDEVGDYQGVVTVISTDGCADTLALSEQFEVYPVPEGALADPVCALNMPEGSGWCTEYRFSDTTAVGVQYQWFFSDGYGTTTTSPELVHDFGVDELEHSVLVILQNEFGCPDTLFREFEVVSELEVFIPNAFMPTADWPNNVFVPVFNSEERVEDYEFVIFNRWGSEVFRTKEVGKPWPGLASMPWNAPGESYAQDGVYNWIVWYRDRLAGSGGLKELRGMVVILR